MEHVYLGRRNLIARTLLFKGEPFSSAEMAAIVRISLQLGDTLIDSDVVGFGAGAVFDWETRADDGVLNMDLGGQALTARRYNKSVLTIYDGTSSDGIICDDALAIHVHGASTASVPTINVVTLSSVSKITSAFVEANLDDNGLLIINHNQDITGPVLVTVEKPDGTKINAAWQRRDNNRVDIDMSAWQPLIGNYNYTIMG
jgi:hypothetical protein